MPIDMSSRRDKSKEHQRALQAFAESEELTGSGDEEDDLDIIRSSRKDLNLSQYIDGRLTLFSCLSVY
jgi:hypothetical protein